MVVVCCDFGVVVVVFVGCWGCGCWCFFVVEVVGVSVVVIWCFVVGVVEIFFMVVVEDVRVVVVVIAGNSGFCSRCGCSGCCSIFF